MALDRSQIKLPELPKETVAVESLGGEVIVRGMLLSERLASDNVHAASRNPREGETEDDAHARAGTAIVFRVLHTCVVDDSGKRLLSIEEWDAFGTAHQTDVFRLFNTAMRLSGQDLGDVEKN